MKTYSKVSSDVNFTEKESYLIRVKTGNETMDRMVYEFADLEFGKYFSIVTKDDYSRTIDIIFGSSSESSFVGSRTAYSTSSGYANGWYTGNAVNVSGTSSTSTTGIVSGGFLTWQNSTMIVSIKDKDEKRLWTADYKYKGGWEMSGFAVNTPQEAARLCIERISKRMKAELRL
jgi:hypothetical protein